MQNIKNILDSLIQSKKSDDAWKLTLIKNWPTIIGSLHEKVSLLKINATNVVLGVYDSSWMQELYLLSNLFLKKINTHLGQNKITSIRFQYIETSASKNKSLKTKFQKQISSTNKNLKLKPQESKALQKIGDLQLAQALQSFLERCKR